METIGRDLEVATGKEAASPCAAGPRDAGPGVLRACLLALYPVALAVGLALFSLAPAAAPFAA